MSFFEKSLKSMLSSKELRNSSLIVSFLKDTKKAYEKNLKTYSNARKSLYLNDVLTNDGEVSLFFSQS